MYLNLIRAIPLTMISGFNDFTAFLANTIKGAESCIFNAFLKLAEDQTECKETQFNILSANIKVVLLIAISTQGFTEAQKSLIWRQMSKMRLTIADWETELRTHDDDQYTELSNDITDLLLCIDSYRANALKDIPEFKSIKDLQPIASTPNDKIPMCINKVLYLIYNQVTYIPEHMCNDPTYGDFIKILVLANNMPVRKSPMTRVWDAVYKVTSCIVKHSVGFTVYLFEKYTYRHILW